jgi:hypothetical protein
LACAEIEEEIGEASQADDEAEEAADISFKCLPQIGKPGRALCQAYKVLSIESMEANCHQN